MGSARFHSAACPWPRAGGVARAHGSRQRRPRRLAGLITVLAVGVGLVLTKAELDRRRNAQSTRKRKFSLIGEESLAQGLHRMALGQLDLAIELLEAPQASQSEWTIHETRKAIKRLRALLCLTRSTLGKRRFARENRALRNCARTLAGARDAEVALASLAQLVDSHPKRLHGSPAVEQMRARLEDERNRALQNAPLSGDHRDMLLKELRGIRARAWEFPDRGFALVAGDLQEIYRRGRRALRRARKQNDSATLHEWRKRVKDLRYSTQMLTRKQPGDPKQQWIARLGARADELSELLGEEHDLALLAGHIHEHRDAFADEKHTRKVLLELIEKRRLRLRRQALKLGGQLYGRAPKRFRKRAARSLRGASSL
ncbi:MAG: CHAD domain-containing protein [Solirubrobacteraceae bacterium]